jgi:ABC-type dipeptide/oligopeptide/nickel transport system permease component
VWTYILRRLLLMIPTLFGVTVVAFCIMQMAPGDPQLTQMGSGGMTGESSQTRDAYLIQKRDLKLDKPLVLNFNYFRDYSGRVRAAAHYLGQSEEETLAELGRLAAGANDPADADRLNLKFLRSLKIDDFKTRLNNLGQHKRLAKAIRVYIQTFCEDNGVYSVPAAIAILQDKQSPLRLKIGAIGCLDYMTAAPFQYTYSRSPTDEETPLVHSGWKMWWKHAEATFPQLDPDRQKGVEKLFAQLVAEPSRAKQAELLEGFYREDMGYFVTRLLAESSTLKEKAMAAAALKLYVSNPLTLTVPLDADAELVDKISGNWLAHFEVHGETYSPGAAAKIGYIFTDTQYAYMVWRLVTFNFGRSALKTREPVSKKILDAVIVSAPLMVMANLMIYLVAVPLGILCAVNRSGWIDRLISLGLFFLYSIPPYVAGMLFLLFLCYGDYLAIFPMMGLFSPMTEGFDLLDYLWHIFLPVTCLSLFSLAGMAMYSRTSMLDVIGQDYIRTARAKGVAEPKVILKHGLRNALIPIITLFAGFLPAMLGGSVLIEVLFGIPGMGQLSWTSIMQKDFPTLMALVYIQAIVVMLSILLTDILYVFVDPRISFEGQGKSA